MSIIKEINAQLNTEGLWDQGIFCEPNGIPVHIKEPVLYTRYSTGGYRGGTCWDDSYPHPYTEEPPKDKWKVLDVFLKKVCPDINYLLYKEIEKCIHTNEETEHEYYGNSTDWVVEYIKMSDILRIINYNGTEIE